MGNYDDTPSQVVEEQGQTVETMEGTSTEGRLEATDRRVRER
jgi:hypothetical protein